MNLLKYYRALAAGMFSAGLAQVGAANFGISSASPTGVVAWTNAFPSGVCTVESAPLLASSGSNWQPLTNYFTTSKAGMGVLPLAPGDNFFRLLAVDISTNTPQGYTNLLRSYGTLHTIAGNGAGRVDGMNYWLSRYEGGYATNAALSRPHFAMADDAGNVYIVDRDSHSVLKVTPDGRIHTAAGTHKQGNGPNYPTNATKVALNMPNGLYVHPDGSFLVLDTGNAKVRRCDTNGQMSTLFTVPRTMATGRGLWADAAEMDVVFCDGTTVLAWNATNGLSILNTNFIDLGNIIPTTGEKNVLVTDRGDDKVYKVDIHGSGAGSRSLVYGKGHGDPVSEGTWAVTNCFNGVRGIWRLPTDGYLFALHEGSQVLYVDPADIVHVFLDGKNGFHSGDGQWFRSPGYKISQARSVTMDSRGNVIIVENDYGYVRQIDFQRLTP